MSENFAALLEESISKITMIQGELVLGSVVEINDDFVIVDAGLKSEAAIPKAEFKNSDGEISVKEGDDVEVAIEAIEDGYGHTKLSRERALRARAWDELERAQVDGDIVMGLVTGRVKGGFTVDVNYVKAFLPGSLVDVTPVKDLAYLEGRELEFKVIMLDRVRNNMVVSRRAVLESELSEDREKLLDTLEEGQIIKGVVKNLTDYGAFVNLGGLDGLLHITDLSWKRVRHPSEVLNVGDDIEVKVLKFDKEHSRVSLGLKQLGGDPWQDLERRYPQSSRLFGRVTNITDYGAFVEIEDGVEGLVHLSEMDWTKKNIHPSKVCHVGDEVEVMVLEIDGERRRISLGMKQCQPNPWDEFASHYKKGDKLTGKIRSITDFGMFVGVDGGIDGLAHVSDLAWDRPGEEVIRDFSKGDEISVVVLAVDPERERISLGLKQASDDPFVEYASEHPKGSRVMGKITEVTARGANIELAENVEGFLRASEMSVDRVEDARSLLKEGEEIETKVTSIDRKNRRITLSVKVLKMDLEDEAIQEYSGQKTEGGTTLGDKLKEQLSKNS